MVHYLNVEALQVWHVAWNMERQNLPLSVPERLIAECEPVEDQAALRGPVLIANNILARPQVSQRHGDAEHSLLLVVREIEDAFQLADEGVQVGIRGWEHGSAPACAGAPVSQPSAA